MIKISLLFLLLIFSLKSYSNDEMNLNQKIKIGHESAKWTASNIDSSQKSGLQKSALNLTYDLSIERRSIGLTFDSSIKTSQSVFQNKYVPNAPLITPYKFFLTKEITNYLKISYGLKSYHFSETFGLNLLDVVNPHDLSEFPFQNPEEMTLPNHIIDSQLQFDKTKILLIFSPYPMKNRLPKTYSPYNPARGIYQHNTHEKYYHHKEFGGRISHLFDNGLDLNLLYFRHHPRFPDSNYNFLTNKMVIIDDLVSSFTLNHSYDLNGFIIRGDTLYQPKSYSLNEKSIIPFQTRRVKRWQIVEGIDKTFDNLTTLGTELHYDTLGDKIWNSWMLQFNLLSDHFEIAPIIFFGLNNPDLWAKPRMTYSFDSGAKIDLSYHHIMKTKKNSTKEGSLVPYQNMNQIRLNFSYEI